MYHINDSAIKHTIFMTLPGFTKLVEKLTNGLKTVEYEFSIYITDTEAARDSEIYFNVPIEDALSDYFGVTVTSFHSDGFTPEGVFIVYTCPENREPLSREAMWTMMMNQSYVDGVIRVSLAEMFDEETNLDGFLDLLSMKLTGTPLLLDTDYDIVMSDKQNIWFYVKGNANAILEKP